MSTRRWPLFMKGGIVLAGIVIAAVLAAVALTDPEPETLPRRLLAWIAGPPPESGPSLTTPAERDVPRPPAEVPPLYSEDWFDDSGYTFAMNFAGPVTDPTSLDQLRDAFDGRGRRGIDFLEPQLDQIAEGSADAQTHRHRLNLILGGLHLFEGEFTEAARRFQAARDAVPASSSDLRANLDALRGITALRRGEVENCVACCNESSCLFPLEPSAVHQFPSGSREAIQHFLAYLDQRPQDLGVRWLLNVAAMTLGEYPDGVPERYRIPLEPFRSARNLGRWVNVAGRVGLNQRGENMAGGCLADDFDNDGRIDLFFSTSNPARGPALFRNLGDGRFEDMAESAGLGSQGGALNASHADFDNDGRLDILLLRGGWESPRRMSLLRNTEDGTFQDVTLEAGLARPIASKAGVWGDHDNDGWVDLFVCGEYDPSRPDPANRCRLYRNRGDGTFEDVADRAGVRNDRNAVGAAWGDYNQDGFPDLYVSNLGAPNRLYRNRGDGTFEDVAPRLGVTGPTHSFACWFWDHDNDGRLDLFVCPYGATLNDVVRDLLGEPTTGERPRLYRNRGDEGFQDVTRDVGLDRVLLPMGCNYGDIDNDGYLDLYLGTGRPAYSYLMPNVLLRNHEGRVFEDVTTSSGTGHLQKGHGVAFADWDRDGDADLIVEAGGATPGDQAHNVVFQNPGHGHHWLRVRLIGTRSNAAALGARIRVDLAGPDGPIGSRFRWISAGSSFGGNPLAPTIGLGTGTRITGLEVIWPSGGRRTFSEVPIDRSIEIREGEDDFQVLDETPIPLPTGS